jgi:L-amino acid N-acyltransferase YncA
VLRVRPAVEADREILLQWRNDGETRRASLTTDEVTPEQHNLWFERMLADPHRVIYLGEVPGELEPIGMVRFDEHSDGVEVSINLNPAFRGARLSRPLLAESIDAYTAVAGENQRFLASIRAENLASVRLFSSLGFTTTEDASDVRRYVRDPARRSAE